MKRGEVYLCPLRAAEPAQHAGMQPALERPASAAHDTMVPVVVLTRDAINQNAPIVIVAPIVESERPARPYPSDVPVRAPEGGLTTDGLILTMQIRAVPRTRLRHLLGTLSANVLAEVDNALRITLDLEEY